MNKFIKLNFCHIVFSIMAFFILVSGSYASNQNIKYDFSDKGLNIIFDDNKKLNLGFDAEFGLVRDGALYASFGLENQIFKFSKMVFHVNGQYDEDSNRQWLFKIDYAPIYDSIKRQIKTERKEYDKDSNGRSIDGNNVYVDWYKNLGSRIYYLGNIPLIEALVGYRFDDHVVKVGRMKTIIGFDESQMPWGDDGKFAPMSYWLSKDLFSGVSYGYDGKILGVSAGLYSGGNPTKGYSNYLNLVESPNIKSNNTPTFAGRVELKYDNPNNDRYNGYIYASYMRNITGSTWNDNIDDGKRDSSVAAHGIMCNINFDDKILNKINVFVQYTEYMSGLTTKSSQKSAFQNSKFKNIKQKGYFVGFNLFLLDEQLNLGGGYESFSRFDYNIFAKHEFQSKSNLNQKQTSYIFHAKYFMKDFAHIGAAYHSIKNPEKYVSEVLDKKKDNRFKIYMYIDI